MINIMFTGNSKVFDGMLTGMLSILKRTKATEPFKFHILTMNLTRLKSNYTEITDEQIDFLNFVVKKFNSDNLVKKYDVTDLYEQEFAGIENEITSYTPYCYIRLLCDKLEGMPDKLLYLDVDVMANDDIMKLYNHDVTNYEYMAVKDHYGKVFINPKYINSGVLLMNMNKIKETNLFAKAREMLKTKRLKFPDQTALFKCAKQIGYLPHIYNDQKRLHNDTVIRHFCKTIIWLPYFHTRNIKQWDIYKVHSVMHIHQFDDVLYDYIYYKKMFEEGRVEEIK